MKQYPWQDRAPFVMGTAMMLGAAWGLAGAAMHPTAAIVGLVLGAAAGTWAGLLATAR